MLTARLNESPASAQPLLIARKEGDKGVRRPRLMLNEKRGDAANWPPICVYIIPYALRQLDAYCSGCTKSCCRIMMGSARSRCRIFSTRQTPEITQCLHLVRGVTMSEQGISIVEAARQCSLSSTFWQSQAYDLPPLHLPSTPSLHCIPHLSLSRMHARYHLVLSSKRCRITSL